jgi:hypothetical protein
MELTRMLLSPRVCAVRTGIYNSRGQTYGATPGFSFLVIFPSVQLHVGWTD